MNPYRSIDINFAPHPILDSDATNMDFYDVLFNGQYRLSGPFEEKPRKNLSFSCLSMHCKQHRKVCRHILHRYLHTLEIGFGVGAFTVFFCFAASFSFVVGARVKSE